MKKLSEAQEKTILKMAGMNYSYLASTDKTPWFSYFDTNASIATIRVLLKLRLIKWRYEKGLLPNKKEYAITKAGRKWLEKH